jgi:hypothetical protein
MSVFKKKFNLCRTKCRQVLKYSGTVFVSTEKGENYVGIVFGYVNNRKFYLLSWKQKNYNYELTTFKAGIKGINLKVYINQW